MFPTPPVPSVLAALEARLRGVPASSDCTARLVATVLAAGLVVAPDGRWVVVYSPAELGHWAGLPARVAARVGLALVQADVFRRDRVSRTRTARSARRRRLELVPVERAGVPVSPVTIGKDA